ncbi:hypothetical protein EGW08_014207, partial [Elysia chlorotica]
RNHGHQIVAQRDGDDGEVRGEGEHWEQNQEVLDGHHRSQRLTTVGSEVESVQIVDAAISNSKDSSHTEEDEVKHEDCAVVPQQDCVQLGLVPDRGHHGWEGVVTHEAVHTHAKQGWRTRRNCNPWVPATLSLPQAHTGQHNHDKK